MIPLFMVSPGEWIQYENKKKTYVVIEHNKILRVKRPGVSSDYEDGRNFDEHPGTRLKDTSGRTITVLSSEFVTVVTK